MKAFANCSSKSRVVAKVEDIDEGFDMLSAADQVRIRRAVEGATATEPAPFPRPAASRQAWRSRGRTPMRQCPGASHRPSTTRRRTTAGDRPRAAATRFDPRRGCGSQWDRKDGSDAGAGRASPAPKPVALPEHDLAATQPPVQLVAIARGLADAAEPKRQEGLPKDARIKSSRDLSKGGTLRTQLGQIGRGIGLDARRGAEVRCTPKHVSFKEGGVQVMRHNGSQNTKQWSLIEVLRKHHDEIAAHYGRDLLLVQRVATQEAKPSSTAAETVVQAHAPPEGSDTGAGHEPKPASLPEHDLAATQPPSPASTDRHWGKGVGWKSGPAPAAGTSRIANSTRPSAPMRGAAVRRAHFDADTAHDDRLRPRNAPSIVDVHMLPVGGEELQDVICASLPKMPTEHVAEIYQEPNSASLVAIERDTGRVAGGLVFRSFKLRRPALSSRSPCWPWLRSFVDVASLGARRARQNRRGCRRYDLYARRQRRGRLLGPPRLPGGGTVNGHVGAGNDYDNSLFMVFRGAVPDEANDNDCVPRQRDDDERSTSDEPAADAGDAFMDATGTDVADTVSPPIPSPETAPDLNQMSEDVFGSPGLGAPVAVPAPAAPSPTRAPPAVLVATTPADDGSLPHSTPTGGSALVDCADAHDGRVAGLGRTRLTLDDPDFAGHRHKRSARGTPSSTAIRHRARRDTPREARGGGRRRGSGRRGRGAPQPSRHRRGPRHRRGGPGQRALR